MGELDAAGWRDLFDPLYGLDGDEPHVRLGWFGTVSYTFHVQEQTFTVFLTLK